MPGAWMALDAWKALAVRGEAPADATLRKAYTAEILRQPDHDPSRALEFVISTASVDRDRDVIALEGWKLTAYRRNPVVLWAHDYRMPPVARATRVTTADGALRARAEFATGEVYPFAETIYRLLRDGFLHATSVGFRPLKHAFNSERGGIDFEAQELLEFSIVPVPANADCLMDAKAAGIDMEPLARWAEETLKALGRTWTGVTLEVAAPVAPDPAVAILAKFERLVDRLAAAPRAEVADEESTVALALEDDEDDEDDDNSAGPRIACGADELHAALLGAVTPVITAEVGRAIARLRGRVD